MLVEQRFIGRRLYDIRPCWNGPLSAVTPSYEEWRRYARYTRDRWGYRTYRQADIDRHQTVGANTFASRLASYTAQLQYEGKTLFAIQTGTYNEGDYSWSGATDENRAFTIRSVEDYQEAYDWYLPADDVEGWYDYDPDWCYSIIFVVTVTSIIE